MDMLEQAKEQWDKARRQQNQLAAELSFCAATIALAEATQVQAAILDAQMSKPQFVQVGNTIHNLDHIVSMRIQDNAPMWAEGEDPPHIIIWYSVQDDDGVAMQDSIHGTDATAFLASISGCVLVCQMPHCTWWNKNTNVVRLDVPEEAQ